MLPAHFSLTVTSLHCHWVLKAAPTVTHSHRWLSSLPANCTSALFLRGRQLVWLTHSLNLQPPQPPPSTSSHIGAIKAQLAYNHVLASCFLGFFVFHTMACAFFLLFLLIWTSTPHRKTTKQTKRTAYNLVYKGRRVSFWGEHNINQGRVVRNTARGPSRPLTLS